MKNRRRSFIISIVILLVGMTVGFVLLNLVYTGPRWVAFIVFLIYVFVVYFTVRNSIKFIKILKDEEKKSK